ncbi:cytochrome P450 [Delphinella strobiligena]|nr:cytochrome P450 [Delphinella strobiligena]
MALSNFLPIAARAHPILSILAIFLFPLLATLLYDIQTWYHMPRGPTPVPFYGNKHQIPRHKPWEQFQLWSHKYGPIYTLWIGRTPLLILSDPAIAIELLEKRSTKYSSRPRMIAMGELYNDNASILVQPYGKEWSIRRKLLHYAMTPKALTLYKPIQEAEATRLCESLLREPERYEGLIERFTSSIVFCVAYGHRIDSLAADVIKERFKFMSYMASLNVPGKYLCETIPALKRMPSFLAPWKREIQEAGKNEAAANLALFEQVKTDIATAQARGEEPTPSLTKLVLEAREKERIALSDSALSYTPASLFGAGSDTTASTLCTAILALITHPPALSRAQDELDTVIGPHRLPTFADENNLPYLRALVKEVLRWRPVAVLGGTPRATTAPDVYENYKIPAGTTVLSNFWAMNLNADYYPEPHTFDPLRFLPLTSSASQPLSDEDAKMYERRYRGSKQYPGRSGQDVFGVGRRVCPGANLAENSLFAALSRLIWTFEVGPVEGVVYDTFDYTEGFNIRPKPFRARITVRSEERREVLMREMVDAERFLEKFTPFG